MRNPADDLFVKVSYTYSRRSTGNTEVSWKRKSVALQLTSFQLASVLPVVQRAHCTQQY